MARIEIQGDEVVVLIEGLDRLLAFKSEITLPLEHVTAVEVAPAEASKIYHGLRLPGTHLPGLITAGTYRQHGEWSFWDVHDPEKAVLLRLRDEHYAKIVVGVEDPSAVAEKLRARIAGRS